MISFFKQETSSLLQKLLADYWVRWAGPPDSVILDQAQTQVGENFQGYLESIGSSVKFIPAEAHWQLGRTENHGGWFSRILDKIICEKAPCTDLRSDPTLHQNSYRTTQADAYVNHAHQTQAQRV